MPAAEQQAEGGKEAWGRCASKTAAALTLQPAEDGSRCLPTRLESYCITLQGADELHLTQDLGKTSTAAAPPAAAPVPVWRRRQLAALHLATAL